MPWLAELHVQCVYLCVSVCVYKLVCVCIVQGTSQSMPWLAELVESSEGALDVLPVQCLCEFLLHDHNVPSPDDDVAKGYRKKQVHISLIHFCLALRSKRDYRDYTFRRRRLLSGLQYIF
jgi:hypothetical protein